MQQLELRDSRHEVEGTLRQRLASGIVQEQTLHTRGFLGLDDDISSAGLLLMAAGQGLAPDAQGLDAAYKQALADTETIKGVLKRVRAPLLVLRGCVCCVEVHYFCSDHGQHACALDGALWQLDPHTYQDHAHLCNIQC